MPIYAYKCSSCGFAQDVLQKVSDAPLTQCPQCETGTFAKQLTAAGFQLRGSGWYATDFKNGSSKNNGAGESKAADSAPKESTSNGGAKKESTSDGGAKTEKASDSASGSCGHGGCSACS
ncbi:MAG TPA: FmdB family zinc ribbon protein [Burkholderiaceae bacterium]|jgi:putative FmdB family regulatory protein|nr:FmdB family zinc ribbon protein [Burkholderiaceae bacterium]